MKKLLHVYRASLAEPATPIEDVDFYSLTNKVQQKLKEQHPWRVIYHDPQNWELIIVDDHEILEFDDEE